MIEPYDGLEPPLFRYLGIGLALIALAAFALRLAGRA